MRYALVGFGKMGRAVEAAAAERGHVRAAVVDPGRPVRGAARTVADARLAGVEVAFEFTEPGAALGNVVALLSRGLAVVCGTTGWDPGSKEVARALAASRGGLIAAPNFSVGVAVFARLAALAAASLGAAGGYDPWVVEMHHRAKKDAPSGTARRIAEIVAGAAPGPGAVPVASVRAGLEPGRHTLGFDGPHDRITLTHEARGREGFAAGAVLAAEWLRGRRGRHAVEEVWDDLLRAGGGRRGRGGRR